MPVRLGLFAGGLEGIAAGRVIFLGLDKLR